MLGNSPFYNRTIRKVVVAFGTIFNDIQVVRYSDNDIGETFKVPLSYGPKEKYLTRITSDPTLTKSIATVVPRMAFELSSVEYDNTRKQMSTLQNFAKQSGVMKSQYAPIPYNFHFTLSIFVRNTEDGTQIVEQILPFFTPDFTITVDFGSLNQKYDIPIILNSVNTNVDYEGDFSSTRLIIWDLEFTVKAFIFPPIKTSGGLIGANNGFALVNIRDYDTMSVGIANTSYVTIKITPDPVTAGPDDPYGFTTVITEYLGANDINV